MRGLAFFFVALSALAGGCGRESSEPAPSRDMETLPRPIDAIREHPDAWEEFVEPVTDQRGFRVKSSASEQRLTVKFRDVDDATKSQTFLLQPGGYYIRTEDRLTVRPSTR